MKNIKSILNSIKKGDKDSLDAIMSITSGESSAAGILSGSMIEQYKQLAQLQTGGHFENSKYTILKSKIKIITEYISTHFFIVEEKICVE